MKREPGSDIIEFNDLDQRRFSGLPDWAPIEAIPGIFEDILAAQVDAATGIQRLNSNDTQDKNYVVRRVSSRATRGACPSYSAPSGCERAW